MIEVTQNINLPMKTEPTITAELGEYPPFKLDCNSLDLLPAGSNC